MTRLTANQAQALLGQPRRLKMGNKPVWECATCAMGYYTKPDLTLGKPGLCFAGCTGKFIRHASIREFERWHELKTLEKAGQIRNLRRQVSYRLEVNGKLICRYVADAVYDERADEPRFIPPRQWRVVVEDSKGFATAVYKLKAKLMAAGACPEFPEGVQIRET